MPRPPNHTHVHEAYRCALRREKELGFEKLDLREKELIATLLMHEEIRNGGFLQWLTNSTGDYAAFAVGFLRRVGCFNRLRLIAKASAYFPEGKIPGSQKERCAYAAKWTSQQIQGFRPIDSEYYAIERDLYDDLVELA